MELLLGLAPRLRPNLGLGRYKLPRATYTIEAYVAAGTGIKPVTQRFKASRSITELTRIIMWYLLSESNGPDLPCKRSAFTLKTKQALCGGERRSCTHIYTVWSRGALHKLAGRIGAISWLRSKLYSFSGCHFHQISLDCVLVDTVGIEPT